MICTVRPQRHEGDPDQVSVGVDGCRGGWFAVALREGETGGLLTPSFSDILAQWPTARLILVDMPIGLADTGRREVESVARRMLGRPRAASVFSVPCRAAVYADSYEEACAANRRDAGCAISRQAWHLTPRIRELDALLRGFPALGDRVREAHPELCFSGLAGRPMRHRKKDPAGRGERLALLEALRPGAAAAIDAMLSRRRRRDVQADDVIDAFALALSARYPLAVIPDPGADAADAASATAGAAMRGGAERASMVYPVVRHPAEGS